MWGVWAGRLRGGAPMPQPAASQRIPAKAKRNQQSTAKTVGGTNSDTTKCSAHNALPSIGGPQGKRLRLAASTTDNANTVDLRRTTNSGRKHHMSRVKKTVNSKRLFI